MRVTVLGCWAPYPRTGGACSGYVLQDGASNVLLDVGHGTFSRLGQFFAPHAMGAVVLTHLHPDHCGDLPCLRHAVAGALRTGRMRRDKIPLYLPKEPTQIAQEIATYTDAFAITYIEDLPLQRVDPGVDARVFTMGPVKYYLLPVEHTLPAYAVGVEGSGYLVYTGDTRVTDSLAQFAHKADILLCEASGLDQDEDFVSHHHMTARQAGALAKEAQVKELIITHFYPEYDLETLRAQAQEGYGARVELATEGDTYFVY